MTMVVFTSKPNEKNKIWLLLFLFVLHNLLISFSANVCDNNPCYNGGTCIPSEHGHVCECVHPYRGHNCRGISWYCSSFLILFQLQDVATH